MAWPADNRAWSVAGPAGVQGSADQIEQAYRQAFLTLDKRISLFLSCRRRAWTR
ncbi:MAG TPA: hypothetical protein VJN42_00575 [Candidatus Acidoferrum sp.]|nr:hypothetical protein [Candidatus Acidoferrum sp.]